MRKYEFKEIESAFSNGCISLKDFSEVLADNLGKKKARKVLRQNLDIKLKEMKMSLEDRQEHLHLISLII